MVFAAGFATSPLQTSNLLDWVFSVVAVPYYLATPENRWAELLFPHLHDWWVITDTSGALRWAFVGLPPDMSIPWDIWAIPMTWWMLFLAALFVASASVSVLLRKQWVDHERLPFPLVQLPIDLLQSPGGRFGLPEMMRNRLFWFGVAIPLGIICFNMVSYWVPGAPYVKFAQGVEMIALRDFPSMRFRLNFYVMGFAYLTSAPILLSVVVFYILGWIQTGIFNRVGITLGSAGDVWSSNDAISSWAGFGALIVMILWGLWMARSHLALVWQKIRDPSAPVDDSQELLPYRWAFIGLIAGALFMAGFLHRQGMPWGTASLLIFGLFIAHLGVTRLLAQTGLIYTIAPLTPMLFALYTVGPSNMSGPALAALGGSYSVMAHGKGQFLPHVFHIARIGPAITKAGRKMMMFLVAVTVLGVAAGVIYTIVESYRLGGVALGAIPYYDHGNTVWSTIVKHMGSAEGADSGRLMCLGIGAALMSALTAAHYILPWWPIHPIGLPIYGTGNVQRNVLTIFVVWIIKTILLRIGGMAMYERAKPFFVGLPIGYAFGVTVSFITDLIWFPGVGHRIHGW